MNYIADVIYLFAVFLSLLTVAVFYKERQYLKAPGVIHLMVYLTCLAVSNFFVVLISSGKILEVPHLYKAFMPLSFIAPVSSYLYLLSTLKDRQLNTKEISAHFLPGIIILIHYIPFILEDKSLKISILERVVVNPEYVINHNYGWIFSEKQVLIIRSIQNLIYLFLSLKVAEEFKKKLKSTTLSERGTIQFRWVRFFIYCQIGYFISIHLVYYLFDNQFSGELNNYWFEQIVFITTSILVLSISSYLLLNPRVLIAAGEVIKLRTTTSVGIDFNLIKRQVLEAQLFRDKDLSQPKLAIDLNFIPSELNKVIKNSEYEHFNDFINSIRLECFIETAIPDELQRNSIEGIASACGFKSPATFYRVFKEKYGTTPKRYLDSLNSDA